MEEVLEEGKIQFRMENETTRHRLLEERLRMRRASAQSMKQVVCDPQWVSLSASQRRVWIVQQLDPECSASNRPLGIRLSGELDIRALEGSLNEIVRRHEALRTIFPDDIGQPIQRVLPELVVTMEIKQLEALPITRREAEVQRIAVAEAERTFDLAKGPLIRPVLLRLSSEENVLLLLMHHIVFDGWSENVLLQELQMLYEAFRKGRGSPLPELPIQYLDFAFWQNQRLQERIEEQMRYWKRQLAAMPPGLALPTDYPRNDGSVSRGANYSMLIGTVLSEQLKALSRRENVTLFMTLLSVFQLLLLRYAGQEDILVGVPVAGRTCPEAEALIGCFMNMLVMRTKLTGDPSFRELLGRVRETALQAFTHQDIPLEKLVEELRPAREGNRWPLFQVIFNLRNLPKRRLPQPGGLCLELFPFDHGAIGGLDLGLEIKETVEGLRCTFNYAQELFRPDTIERMGRDFWTLLEAVAANVEHPISGYAVLTGGPAFPAPDWGRPEMPRNFVTPRSPFERKLAEIWAEVLGLRRVGVHDNFFEVGGHSLLATRLIVRVHATFAVHLAFRTLLEKPTIEKLALVISQELTERTGQKDLTAVLESLEGLSEEETQRLTERKG